MVESPRQPARDVDVSGHYGPVRQRPARTVEPDVRLIASGTKPTNEALSVTSRFP